tara:strand:- start:502 stop:654 length:153 start_codon:yes stop_codon:yes gene_type:complete
MAKMTKVQAKRSLELIATKVLNLYQNGFITAKDLVEQAKFTERIINRLKK